MNKEKLHISIYPPVARQLRVFAAENGVRQGHALAALLALAYSRPQEEVHNSVAACDLESGEIVPEGVRVSDYVEKARQEAVAPEEY